MEQVYTPSERITALRFFLTIAVVFIHIMPKEVVPLEAGGLSWRNAYIFISDLFSHTMGYSVVPCFFVLSGYFFFRSADWGMKDYAASLKVRTRSLLQPYLFWNIALVAAVFIKVYGMQAVGLSGSDIELQQIKDNTIMGLLLDPVNYPLWYIKDLMLMCLVSPLIYFVLRRLSMLSIAVLLALYLLPNWLGLPMTALTFFGLGACLCLNNIELTSLMRLPYRWVIVALWVGISGLQAFVESSALLPVGILLGVPSLMTIVDAMPRWSPALFRWCLRHAAAGFFIYVVHIIYIIAWMKGLVARSPLYGTGWGDLLGYFFVGISTLLICLGLYYLLRRIAPRLLAFSLGGRA